MSQFGELFQSADFKTEKHAPVIEIGEVVKGGRTMVTVSVGKEIAHPNTSEHHIAWIDVYFHVQGEKFPFHLGKFEFSSHGSSAQSTVLTSPFATFALVTEKPGTIYATSYCNIHGLWQGSAQLNVE